MHIDINFWLNYSLLLFTSSCCTKHFRSKIPELTIVLCKNPLKLFKVPVYLVTGEDFRIDLIINVEAKGTDLAILKLLIKVIVLIVLAIATPSIFLRGEVRIWAETWVVGAITWLHAWMCGILCSRFLLLLHCGSILIVRNHMLSLLKKSLYFLRTVFLLHKLITWVA